MLQRSQSIGALSLVLSAFAIPCVVLAKYIESILHWGSWEVLKFASRHGLLAPPETSGPESLKPPDLLMLNDFTATALLLWFGVYLAASGALIALWSEARREENLYIAAGLVCNCLALVVVNRAVGLAVLAGGTAVILGIRSSRKRHRPDLFASTQERSASPRTPAVSNEA